MNEGKRTVAVVDDDESLARSLERLLRASGYEASTYPSAEAFLAAATRPDCLVLDIHLGGMSGLDLLRRLHEDGVQVPVIFVTAHDAPEVHAEAQRGGCAAYLLKPVPAGSLLAALAKAIQPAVSG